ncbi:class I adenylate-forming enzyme family protein [Alisedimentitalea sp. MJ-SS2]|uniref:class I adenylate-forming enzyme family protein n=1 Tax=Aliisedimentitalea sp. MJ-SS2 TaxID=3049795 RepID=UPI0029106C22|nr:class I adenylate-forming enzyme family protein [Alisedimentitalea sp. MJ-SS2]MDU8926890.1 class I adenylate-forming enzyme family protein [Alisedimentitalea sp. MJ-SS2]
MTSLFDNGPWAPCPDPFNFTAHVLGRAGDLPDKIALAVLGPARAERWSYAKLEAAVRGTGTGLLQQGLKPGDIVLMRLGNSVEFPIAYLGAIAVGLVPVPTSSQLTEREVANMIDTLDPAAILLGEGIACPETAIKTILQANLEAMRDLSPCAYDMGDPDRLAYIIFTSGTSGKPRAVMHAHRAIWARGMMHEGWYGLSATDRLCHAGAFNWTYTLGTGLMDPWSVGATALIPAPGTAPEQLPLLLKRHDATTFAAAPGVYRKILQAHETLNLPKLRHGLSAGEKLSESLRDQWQSASGKPVYEAFGMSECSTFISAGPGQPAQAGSLGSPQQGRRVAILDEDTGQPVPLGEDGTIAVSNRDPGLMLGYLDAPEDTAARFRGEWFLTGDHGAMNDKGQIEYHARVDDMMNAGGYRVSPLEVEAALQSVPGLHEIAVTEVEVKSDARVIAAFYTADAPLDEAALKAHAAERLARYKQPRMFVHVDSLPRNPNGKLQRQTLKSLAMI